jgi:superoxide oxidase
MAWRNSTDRYGSLSIGLHWLMLLLLAAVYACIELREFYPRGSDPRNALKAWHFMLGLSVLILVVIRIIARLLGPTPEIKPQPPRWQLLPAHAVHLFLYALMIGMPIAGWLILSAEGARIPFFGLELPALIGADKDLAHDIEDWHKLFGTIGYYVIGVHAAAALIHHYFMRDNTLLRMLPGRRR